MGFLSGILSGGAALNVLGGMAQGYNQKVATDRKEAYESSRDDKKIEAEKSLLNTRLEAEKTSAMEVAKAKLKADKETKIAVQKLKNKNLAIKNKPKGTQISFEKYLPENLYFKDKQFLIPKRSEYDASTYWAALQNEFKPEFFKQIRSDKSGTFSLTGSQNAKNDVNLVSETMVDAALETLEVVTQQSTSGDKVTDIKIMTSPLVEKFLNTYPELGDLFEKRMNVKLEKIKTELQSSVGNSGSVSNLETTDTGDTKITYALDDKYYLVADYNNDGKADFVKDKKIVNQAIANLNHPDLTGLNVEEKMGRLDSMVKDKAPILHKAHGGELIVNAVTQLKSHLSSYKIPLSAAGDGNGNREKIRDFFQNTTLGQMLNVHPNLAIQVVAMSLPSSIVGSQTFQPLRGGLVGNQLYSNTQEFKILQEKNDLLKLDTNAKKLGFKDSSTADYKLLSLDRIMLPAKELVKMLKAPVEERVYTGINQKFFKAWTGIQEQFADFVPMAREQIASGKGLFDESAIKELQKIQKETNELLKKSNDTNLSAKERNAALFGYYSGVMTFTMAASVQGGSDGAVDSRTISDKDVQLWKGILNLGTNLSYRSGQTAILESIITDAEVKTEILRAYKSPDDRIKSAAKILNNAHYGTMSISAYQSLQEKYGKEIDRYVEAAEKGNIIPANQATFKNGKSLISNQFESNKLKPKADNATTSKGSISVDNLLSGGTK